MAAMKRELENLIQQKLKEKAENRAIIEHAFLIMKSANLIIYQRLMRLI